MDSWWELGEGFGYTGGEPNLATLPCPHCGYKGNFTRELDKQSVSQTTGKILHFDVLYCRGCLLYLFLIWSADSSGAGLHDYKIFPPSLKTSPEAPEHWPEQVGTAWEQAHKSLATESWDAAAVMAGRSLQAAAREMGAQGDRLQSEIADLREKGILTDAMIEWVDEIRLIRNIGAHPDSVETSVDPDDARDIVKFLDYFLIYAYDLPKQIQDYRTRRNDEPKEGD